MKPLWVEFPDIPWGSAGWRMGFGETYWYAWREWFLNLAYDEREKYKAEWREPESWIGLYPFIEAGTTPQWLVERRQKLNEPQLPPNQSEMEITETYRIVWLMRRYLTKLIYPGVPMALQEKEVDEYSVDFYAEPDGKKWRISGLSAGGFLMKRVPNHV
jgi:hypothetical protein